MSEPALNALASSMSGLFRKDGTAQGVAKQRLTESLAEPGKRVIYDPFADRFVKGASVVKCMGHDWTYWLGDKLIPGFHELLIARTRLIDEFVKEEVAGGATQYLILGAGYDTRAFHLGLPESLTVFEVDQEAVQELKKAGLPEAAISKPSVTFVSVDFDKETLSEQLVKAGFVVGKKTVVTLEGVTQYITREGAEATLKEVGALVGPGSSIFISYVDSRLETDPAAICGKGYVKPETVQIIPRLAAKAAGEPWISYYAVSDMAALLVSCGFDVVSDRSVDDANTYFRDVGREIPSEKLMMIERYVVGAKV